MFSVPPMQLKKPDLYFTRGYF